ncbi:hypothetical protein KP509_39G011300 [Ceratopteris richardii]|uniref:Uncharacterized protein n=1 Tax=Ceratopteris richardii TaxID=49495 RepID=A0A8T2PYQ0_CERRI|nr:hypothetical protein KP509_39G011300 [Ceratopteris richardii]
MRPRHGEAGCGLRFRILGYGGRFHGHRAGERRALAWVSDLVHLASAVESGVVASRATEGSASAFTLWFMYSFDDSVTKSVTVSVIMRVDRALPSSFAHSVMFPSVAARQYASTAFIAALHAALSRSSAASSAPITVLTAILWSPSTNTVMIKSFWCSHGQSVLQFDHNVVAFSLSVEFGDPLD